MPSEPTTAVATRVSARPAQLIEAAIEETDQLESELIREAVRHYIRSNPDNIQAFRPERDLEAFGRSLTEEWP